MFPFDLSVSRRTAELFGAQRRNASVRQLKFDGLSGAVLVRANEKQINAS